MKNPINIYKTTDGKLKTVFNKNYDFSMETDAAFDTMEIIKMLNDEDTMVYVHYKELVLHTSLEYSNKIEDWLIDLLYGTEMK